MSVILRIRKLNTKLTTRIQVRVFIRFFFSLCVVLLYSDAEKRNCCNKDVYYYDYCDFATVVSQASWKEFRLCCRRVRAHVPTIILARNWFAHDFNGCRIKNYTFISMIPMYLLWLLGYVYFTRWCRVVKDKKISISIYFIIIM